MLSRLHAFVKRVDEEFHAVGLLTLGYIKSVLGIIMGSFHDSELTLESVEFSLLLADSLVADLVLHKLIVLLLKDIEGITLVFESFSLLMSLSEEAIQVILERFETFGGLILHNRGLLSEHADLSFE